MLTDPSSIHLLLIEDSADDAELLALELQRSGLKPDITRIETLEQLTKALATGGWDAIVSDYQLATFTASDALETVKGLQVEIPFIVVSGAIGEETAVKLMRAGAHDFFLKERLTRLGQAIQRETRDAAVRAEHRRTLLQLKESEERFRTLADAAPVMIWSTSPDLQRVYFNKPWLDFRGRDLAQESGDGWLEGIHLDDRERVRAILAALPERRDYSWEFRLRRADGAYRWVMERGIPHYEPGGRFAGYLGSSVDITALKQSEEALKQAVKARDEFLSAASHELRTPLAALILQLDLFQKIRPNRPPEETKQVESARRQLWRLAKLVDTMLDVTRITSGRLQLSPREANLAAVVAEVVSALRDSIERSGSTVTVHATDVIGVWDPVHLETVVTNLVANAIKYGEGAPIEIEVDQRDHVAHLAVTDHGIGIPADAQERIFERFERGVTESAYSGLGIGLWIVREIVEAHGGVVRVTSRPDGSTFEVELPLPPGSVSG